MLVICEPICQCLLLIFRCLFKSDSSLGHVGDAYSDKFCMGLFLAPSFEVFLVEVPLLTFRSFTSLFRLVSLGITRLLFRRFIKFYFLYFQLLKLLFYFDGLGSRYEVTALDVVVHWAPGIRIVALRTVKRLRIGNFRLLTQMDILQFYYAEIIKNLPDLVTTKIHIFDYFLELGVLLFEIIPVFFPGAVLGQNVYLFGKFEVPNIIRLLLPNLVLDFVAEGALIMGENIIFGMRNILW